MDTHFDLKVLLVGDPHFQLENTEEVDLFIDRLTKLAKETQPTWIVILGDILHTHERINSLVMNKAYAFIDTMRKITKTIVLVGNHDMCFSPNTLVRLANGGTKQACDVIKGDKLMGDDGTPRIVDRLLSGTSRMFRVKYGNSMSIDVTTDHILCLIDKNLVKYDITVNQWLSDPYAQECLYGYTSTERLYKITILEIFYGNDRYNGWTFSGPEKRFLLANEIVAHNCNNQQFLSENHWMNAMKEWDNVVIVDKIHTETVNNELYMFSPYVYTGRFIEALNTYNTTPDIWKSARCIIAHQEIRGCKMGAIISEHGDEWLLEYPPLICGHIHSNQHPQENVYYPGSAMQHAFGESEKNIIAITTFKPKERDYQLQEIDLGLPRKRIVYVSTDNISTYTPPNTDDKLKLTISGDTEEFKTFKRTDKYKQLVEDGIKVVFKPNNKLITDNNSNITTSDFHEIVMDLVNKEDDLYLLQAYELIFNDKLIMI